MSESGLQLRDVQYFSSLVFHRAEVQWKQLVGKQALCHKYIFPLLSTGCIASCQEADSSLTYSSSLPWEPSVPFTNSFLMPGKKGLVLQIPAEIMHCADCEIQHLSCMFPPPEKEFTVLIPSDFNVQTTCQRRTLHTHPMRTECRMNPLICCYIIWTCCFFPGTLPVKVFKVILHRKETYHTHMNDYSLNYS